MILKYILFCSMISSFMYFCFRICTRDMRIYIYFLLVFFVLPFVAHGQSYPEVIFDNSLSNGSYAKSKVSYRGDSWVENVNMNLLVSDTLFFTPGNSLSLKYLSSSNGNWSVRINYARQKTNYRFNIQDQLSFFIYVSSKQTKLQELPRIFIKTSHGITDTLLLNKYIANYATSKWIQVKIPNTAFKNIPSESVISAIGFSQHMASSQMNHVFVDQIEFLPGKYAPARLTTPAILSEATPYDKMVYLKWQSPLSPGLRYVKIYRSLNGKDFEPTDIRPIYMQSALDVVPQVGQKYFYKIVWLDNDYKESPASGVKEVMPINLSDSNITDFIQAAHINYFVENYDINSGMYMPFRSKDKAIVSTKETAGAILSMIIGVEKKAVSRQVLLQRLSKITYFLMRAQNRNGIYPAYFDGRKGVPDYRSGTAQYDVQATASLIESLLIAREYFDGNDEIERDLRNRITALYEQINWTAIANDSLLLNAKFSVVDDDLTLSKNLLVPLFGVNESINTYLLAISAKRNPLPPKAYFDAVYNTFGIQRAGYIEEQDSDVYADSLTNLVYDRPSMVNVLVVDTLTRNSILNPITKYGVNLPFGVLNGSLMELYKPFTTINPSLLKDSVCNWKDALKVYTEFVKRRDNELGLGTGNSDIWGFYQHKDSIGNYRINPAIAPSSVIVDKGFGQRALLSLYKDYGDVLFTEYGFRSWLDLRNNDESEEYNAQHQSMLAVMIENSKTGLIWKLYERIPELKEGRKKLFETASSEVD